MLDYSDAIFQIPVRFMPLDGPEGEWPPVEEWSDPHWAHWLREHNKYSYLKQWSDAEITQYLEHDRYFYGISFQRHHTEAPWWFYTPTPIAIPFHSLKIRNILFGGAAGGSKSHSARHDAYRHALALPNFKGIIMRRTFEELERNHLEAASKEIEQINGYFEDERFATNIDSAALDYVSTKHRIRVKTHGRGKDSSLLFGHCQNPGDENKYLGDDYEGLYPDEGATFIKDQITGVAGRLRTKRRGFIPFCRMTSNPGGAHTLWLKDYHIDKNVDKIREHNPRYNPNNYAFIQAMLYDNPYYMDPDGTYSTYEERLFEYDKERRLQLLLGDWTALAGQFFPEFSEKTHVKRLHIPEGTRIERWIDWGYDPHYGICLWVALLPSGRIYVFAEYKFNGKHAKVKLVASEVAKNIDRLTKEDIFPLVKNKRISKSVADPAMWGEGKGSTGVDYAEDFGKSGVPVIKANNSRVLGWGRLRHWFRLAPDGDPWLIIDPDCVTTIRTIPGLVRDKNDPDDIDTTGEDHPADTLRYGVMAHPIPKTITTNKIIIPDSAADVLRSLLSGNSRSFQPGMVS